MAPFGIGKSQSARGGVRQSGADAVQLVIEYVKQETLAPLKGLGRYLLFGIVGSLALCAGVLLLLVGLLRVLQSETGTTFSGDLSWLPYVIVCAAAVVVMSAAAWRITKGPAARCRRGPKAKAGGSRE